MNINIFTLTENTATRNFLAEWGLSILIEADNKRILLDTGAGFSAAYNAHLAGIDLRTIDLIVLSHGHFDHTGGLKDILARRNDAIDIIAHPSIWEAKYSIRENNKRYIGIPFMREQLEGLGAHFIFSDKPVWITENIVTSGEVPFVTGYEETDRALYKIENKNLVQDNFQDDLSLAIKTDKGLAVFLGCAHRGMINIIMHFQKITGDKRIYSVVGGTHLISASQERLNKTIDELKKIGIKKLGVSHCTGFEASARLSSEFKDSFFLNSSGSTHKLM
ncbi:MAG: MBL fold metallo-hydrolase [Deltaproteobacteria bacterium]|nr:MBL fold metallo-hydrolase [Deltaproteobacteria bacterium]